MGIVAVVSRNEKLFALKPKKSFHLVRLRLGGAIQIRVIFVIAAKENIKQRKVIIGNMLIDCETLTTIESIGKPKKRVE